MGDRYEAYTMLDRHFYDAVRGVVAVAALGTAVGAFALDPLIAAVVPPPLLVGFAAFLRVLPGPAARPAPRGSMSGV